MESDNSRKKSITTKRIAFAGVLAAVYVILSLISVGTNDFRISVETLVILTAATVLGPVEGCLVGITGELVHQLLLYGIDATTVLWLIPYAAEGLIAGMVSAKRTGQLTSKTAVPVVIAGEAVLLVLVTPVNAVTAIIQGWGNWVTILGGIPVRLVITAVRIVIYILILPVLVRPLFRIINENNDK